MLGSYEQYRTRGDGYSLKSFFKTIIKMLIIICLLYIVVTGFFIDTYSIHSTAMNPALANDDVVLTAPVVYGAYSSLLGIRFPGFAKPARGDIVVIKPPYLPRQSFMNKLISPLLKFFSFQKARLVRDPAGNFVNEQVIKRIVGIPGDAIKIERFIVYIKPKGAEEFKTERELTGNSYKIFDEFSDYIFPKGWNTGLPFSGFMQEIILGQDEYFVIGDNRLLFSDSRFFGPVHFDALLSKVIFRYWPFEKFGGL
jgi:signal peptidase I